MSNERYRRWDDADAVARFASKTPGDFFATETHFLEGRTDDIASVLDIGCASGRLVELLASYGCHPAYTGVDISAEQVASASALYPEASFHRGNALALALPGGFDLVNATGVMQHEPRLHDLIRRMVGWSRCYVLFDVKLSDLDEDVIDITRSHAGTAQHPLFFNVLSARRFLDFLRDLDGIAAAAVFGYETPPNRNTTLPPEITRLVSAGVFLGVGEGPAALSVDLPEGLLL